MKPEESTSLEEYIRKLFLHDAIELLRRPQDGTADVCIGDYTIGKVTRDEDDEDTSYSLQLSIRQDDYDQYLRTLFPRLDFEIRKRPQKDDSVEFYVGEEFIGVLFRADENNDVSYWLEIAILEFDLEGEDEDEDEDDADAF